MDLAGSRVSGFMYVCFSLRMYRHTSQQSMGTEMLMEREDEERQIDTKRDTSVDKASAC